MFPVSRKCKYANTAETTGSVSNNKVDFYSTINMISYTHKHTRAKTQ